MDASRGQFADDLPDQAQLITRNKPRVVHTVQYVRGNFWDGETFTSLEEAQQAAMIWCHDTAGSRIHGTACTRPLEVFTAEEQRGHRPHC